MACSVYTEQDGSKRQEPAKNGDSVARYSADEADADATRQLAQDGHDGRRHRSAPFQQPPSAPRSSSKRGLRAAGPDDDEDVAGRRRHGSDVAAQDVADTPTHAVAHHGAAEAPAGRDPEAVMVEGIGQEAHDDESIGARAAVGCHAGEVPAAAQHGQGTPAGGPGVRR